MMAVSVVLFNNPKPWSLLLYQSCLCVDLPWILPIFLTISLLCFPDTMEQINSQIRDLAVTP